MDKKIEMKNITVDIYELGMLRRDIEKWSPSIDLGNEELKRICTGLLLITDDAEVGFDNLIGMKFEEVRQFLIRKHFEHLTRLREKLYSL